MVLPGEEEDVCLKKGVFCFLVHGSFIIWSFMVTVMLFGYFFQKIVKNEISKNIIQFFFNFFIQKFAKSRLVVCKTWFYLFIKIQAVTRGLRPKLEVIEVKPR